MSFYLIFINLKVIEVLQFILFFLYDEAKSLPTYKISLTFASDYVETELERFKKSAGDYVKLYTAKGSLMAPSLVTLQALVSNIHTTSAVSLFSEGLRQLGFEE